MLLVETEFRNGLSKADTESLDRRNDYCSHDILATWKYDVKTIELWKK